MERNNFRSIREEMKSISDNSNSIGLNRDELTLLDEIIDIVKRKARQGLYRTIIKLSTVRCDIRLNRIDIDKIITVLKSPKYNFDVSLVDDIRDNYNLNHALSISWASKKFDSNIEVEEDDEELVFFEI